MKKLLWLPFFAVWMSFFAASAFAQTVDTSSPEALVKTITTNVMNSVKNDSALQSGDIGRISELVNQEILPYTDFDRTTRLVMGRYWNTATPEQRAQITTQFKILLIRTYAGAIAQVRDQQIQYLPFHSSPGDTDVVVRTQVNNAGNQIELDYRLAKTSGGWKVYDINVLGAWLIQAYRQQFAEQIQSSGIDGLVQFLTTRNQQLAGGK